MAGGSGGASADNNSVAQTNQGQSSTANPYSSQSVMSPLVQQMTGQQTTPFQQAGLEAIMSSFMNMAQPNQLTQQPQQAGIMPAYGNPALSYRPNYEVIHQNLSRVKPSVYKTELDDAKARIAELEAQLAPRPDNSWTGSAG